MSPIDPRKAWDAASGGTFITSDEKQMIHAKQAPIYVYDAEPSTESQWGDNQTVFHVRSNEHATGDMRLLAFAHTMHREKLAAACKMLTAASPGDAVGPYYLHKFTTNNGNDAWALKLEPQTDIKPATTPAPAPAPKQPEPVAAVQTTDDDLPF